MVFGCVLFFVFLIYRYISCLYGHGWNFVGLDIIPPWQRQAFALMIAAQVALGGDNSDHCNPGVSTWFPDLRRLGWRVKLSQLTQLHMVWGCLVGLVFLHFCTSIILGRHASPAVASFFLLYRGTSTWLKLAGLLDCRPLRNRCACCLTGVEMSSEGKAAWNTAVQSFHITPPHLNGAFCTPPGPAPPHDY